MTGYQLPWLITETENKVLSLQKIKRKQTLNSDWAVVLEKTAMGV
jgi:hypothetical protein